MSIKEISQGVLTFDEVKVKELTQADLDVET